MRRCCIALVLSIAVTTFGASSSSHAEVDTLVIGASVFSSSLSPASDGYNTLSLIYQTWEPLVARDANDKLIPALALRWENLSPTHWRFHLRENVKWHDGKPFTATDVKFTIDYVIDPETIYVRKSRIAGVERTEVIDSTTVDIYTTSPNPLLLRGLSDIPIEQKEITETLGLTEARRKPIGTGPWKYVEWVAGDHYDLTANLDYWGGPPATKHLRIRAIPEGSTRVSSLLAGETHIIEEVPVDLLPVIESRNTLEIDTIESSVSLMLSFDTRNPPFDDVRARLAMDYAIDKKTLLQQMLGSYGSVLDGQLVTHSTFGHNPSIGARPYDPAKAKTLLAEAGLAEGFEIQINTLSGRYVSDVDIASAAAGMMTEVGVRTSVNVVEGAVMSQLDRNKKQGPVYLVGWFSIGDADFNTVWFTDQSKRNYWSNEEYNQLWKEARSTLDADIRLNIYHRMMEIMHEEVPSVFLFGLPRIYGRSASVEGWQPSRDSLLRLHKVKVK